MRSMCEEWSDVQVQLTLPKRALMLDGAEKNKTKKGRNRCDDGKERQGQQARTKKEQAGSQLRTGIGREAALKASEA